MQRTNSVLNTSIKQETLITLESGSYYRQDNNGKNSSLGFSIMFKKLHSLLLPVILVSLSLVWLQTAPVKAEEEEPQENTIIMGPIEDCKERMFTERAILHCLNEHLEEAEKTYEDASHKAQQKAHTAEDIQTRRGAVKAFTASSLTFESYRESECYRQKSLIKNDMEAHFIYLACKTDLFYRRAHTLGKHLQ